MIVAIDGPAGSGKGTVTKLIAKRMGLINLDTGATYRCVALETIRRGLTLEEKQKIIDLVDDLDIEFEYENDDIKVFLNGEDVTSEIRNMEVTKIVSQVSSIVAVRLKMVELQRRMAKGKDVIMEGRDIGTYVFPNADVKIYLDADVEERAKRRFKENQEKGIDSSYEEILENIKLRDENDKNKEIGSLKIADDAIIVDSSKLTIEEMTNKVEEIIREKK
ncbi:MAG: (d)CMP kinase [Clostridia bacterium]|jgi:cytidylate kinase|nr:(d)CMP kinase [Clostridia bacterium]